MSEVVEEAAENTTVVEPAGPPPGWTPAVMVDKYIQLRDRKAELEKKHKEELAPYRKVMDQLEGWLLMSMQDTGAESIRTANGTAYKSETTSLHISDWAKARDFIVENEMWEAMERRLSKTVVMETIRERGEPWPGVEIRREIEVNIRRPTGREKESAA